jgi:predicted choloylglycine hydrolase
MYKRLYVLLLLCTALQLVSCGTAKSIHHKPVTEGYNTTSPVVIKHNDTVYTSGNNFFLKNKQQLWELYIEGDALQLGLLNGALTQEIKEKQEDAFMGKLKQIVPSKFKQKLLRQFLKWYNRKLYLNVPEEYKTEIYGISQYSSDEYNYVAPPYLRALYLHAAHDIGHALADLALVGCTSFAAWDEKTEDGSLLIARNLDFYAGDDFAEDKVIAFVKPDKGYPYMTVSWTGMIGNLSGMNAEGLTVTINAGKSDVPLVAKTPISILSREILQYAKNIDEAIAIAKKRQVFVSESIMIGSAYDGKAILIEVSPNKFGVYDVPNTSQLICSNHFQSDAYKDDKNNNETILNSHSAYRYERMTELLSEADKVNPVKAAAIMRNTKGLNDETLGYGNEKAINQLLAHHSIIFKPEQRLVWVSANPYVLGEYVAYDLKAIFSQRHSDNKKSLAKEGLNIPEDPFVHTQAFKNYEEFRRQDRVIDHAIAEKEDLPQDFIKKYQSLNPDYWKVYYSVGRYYYNRGYYAAAKAEFEKALRTEIVTLPLKQNTEGYIRKINNKLD